MSHLCMTHVVCTLNIINFLKSCTSVFFFFFNDSPRKWGFPFVNLGRPAYYPPVSSLFVLVKLLLSEGFIHFPRKSPGNFGNFHPPPPPVSTLKPTFYPRQTPPNPPNFAKKVVLHRYTIHTLYRLWEKNGAILWDYLEFEVGKNVLKPLALSPLRRQIET